MRESLNLRHAKSQLLPVVIPMIAGPSLNEAGIKASFDGLDLDHVSPPTTDEYRDVLRQYDATLCEALAVGQEASGRLEIAYIGFGTHLFARICAHAAHLIFAAPHSRWARCEFQRWDFSAVASHARAILEGHLLFTYVTQTPSSADEWSAKMNLMNLHDCTARMRLFEDAPDELSGFSAQAEELKGKLRNNTWFRELSATEQKRLLTGKHQTIQPRAVLLQNLGWKKSDYQRMWHLYSQFTHVLPLSFYRLEPNGRGSGLENDCDKTYTYLSIILSNILLRDATDRMVEMFPDVAGVRCGIDSKFTPGPRRNLPKHKKRHRR